uniref:Integral membrane protein n=1 Tax=Streptomyces sp. NBC_00049 TaxID=2903617 RepID=A0AAU2JTW1_9ACTN
MSQNFQPPAPDSYTEAPAAAAPARSGNIGLGIAAAVVAALVAAGAYGAIMNAIDREIGYAAAGVGLLVGLAAGKLGGRNPILPVVAAVLSLGAVYLGQLFFIALALAEYGNVGVGDVLSQVGVGGLNDLWKEGTDAMSFLFLAIGGFVAYGAAKKVSD